MPGTPPYAARATASINAPIDRSWALLLDFRRYGEWNPFIRSVDAPAESLRVGSRFRLHVVWPDGSGRASSREKVDVLRPPSIEPDGTQQAVLSYVYVDTLARVGLLRATRTHVLTQRPGGPTLYETEEQFAGPFARFIPLRKVQAGFDAQTKAFKQHLEEENSQAAQARPSR